MNMKIVTILTIALIYSLNIQSQDITSNPIGVWDIDRSNTPFFSYFGDLPYSVSLKNGNPVVIHDDPYFLLGNYKFKIFTHISGEYEVFTPERVIARFNKKEKTSASITINGNKQIITGINSVAGNPNKTSRNFGLGYAEYTYNLPNDIVLKRIFSVPPSEKINQGTSGTLLHISIVNNGNENAIINYQETIEIAYEQITFYDKKELKYASNFQQQNNIIRVNPTVIDLEKYYPFVNENEKSSEEFFPPSFFMKALNADTEQTISNSTIKNTNSFTLKPNEHKNLSFVIGYSLDRKDSDIKNTCNELENIKYNPNANIRHTEGAFVENWKSKLMSFKNETDIDLQQELLWHNYNLETLATYSHFFKETFIPQGTMYFFSWGIRAAPRDHLQYAMAASYTNPELAKSIMRYTLKKSYKNGNIPFIDKGYGHVTSKYMYTSDQELYFLSVIAEYLRITKDYNFLNEEVGYFSSNETNTVLHRIGEYYSYFKEEVGTGPKGLVKLRNSDWNDLIFYKLDSKYNASFNSNESHMNTTMLVSSFNKLAKELTNASKQTSLDKVKTELISFSDNLTNYRNKVWLAFLNDHKERTFSKRMYFAGRTIGDDNLFLEPQGFLMQIDEYEIERKKNLYNEIQHRILNSEKIGARQVEKLEISEEFFGSRENGGFWYSLNGPLVIGLSTWNMDAAWQLFHKQTLKSQSKQFPNYWASYWASFDSLDSSILPSEGLHAQQRFPAKMKTTYCAHIHAWLVYEYCYLKELKN